MNYRSTPHATTNVSPYQLMFNREMNNLLPNIENVKIKKKDNVNTKHDYKTKIESESKEKNKTYADMKRNTQQHKFDIGDKVLCKQKKINKLSPPFDPNHYIVRKILGTQITAQRGSQMIVRNASFFKKFTERKVAASEHDHVNQFQQWSKPTTNSYDWNLYSEATITNNVQEIHNNNNTNTNKVQEIQNNNSIINNNSDNTNDTSSEDEEVFQDAAGPQYRSSRGNLPVKFKDYIL